VIISRFSVALRASPLFRCSRVKAQLGRNVVSARIWVNAISGSVRLETIAQSAFGSRAKPSFPNFLQLFSVA
jgi:hypothetical protein